VTILLHGRGGSADDIASLAGVLAIDRMTFLIPEATGHTWYPQRFLAPLAANEPWLGSALGVVATLVGQVTAAGIATDRLAIAGFSQGACLALESVARAPARYGAAIAFSGGLIGPPDEPRPPAAGGSLGGTPVFMASVPTALFLSVGTIVAILLGNKSPGDISLALLWVGIDLMRCLFGFSAGGLIGDWIERRKYPQFYSRGFTESLATLRRNQARGFDRVTLGFGRLTSSIGPLVPLLGVIITSMVGLYAAQTAAKRAQENTAKPPVATSPAPTPSPAR